MPDKHRPEAETEATTFEREVLIPQATPQKRRTTLITKRQTIAPAKAKSSRRKTKPERE